MAEKRKCTKDPTRAVAFFLKKVICVGPVNQSFKSVFLQEYRRISMTRSSTDHPPSLYCLAGAQSQWHLNW